MDVEGAEAAQHTLLGQVVLGRYRVVRPLARGGMGMVYLGRVEGAAGFARPVVIKTVIPQLGDDSKMEGMFVREAHILANLQHPGIVGVLDFGQVRGSHLMVLEYVHGYHLGQWGRYLGRSKRQFAVDHVILIGMRVLEALHYAHQHSRVDGTSLGIVHRDVSPANILIDVQGNVKLYDFGIARMSDEDSDYKTQEGVFKGTIPFSAPETIQGLPATPQSDLYSLAVVLYQLLSGSNPFKGGHPNETLHRVLTLEAAPLSALREDIPPEVEAAILKGLSKKPSARFQTAAEFALALRAGRSSSDEEVSLNFEKAVADDFLGDMPRELGLESLDARDQAWREAQRGSDAPASLGPPTASPSSSPPTITATAPAGNLSRSARPGQSGADSAWRPRFLWAAAALLLAVGSVAAWRSLGAPSSPASAPSTRFLVVEKQTQVEAPDQKLPEPASPSELPLLAGNEGAVPLPSAPRLKSTPVPASSLPAATDEPARLSRAFQKQQGRVQQCFLTHTKDVEGQPRIAVRFSIDQSGGVKSAELSPQALTGTPLGSCILGAARSTQFGPQSQELSFTIPITARRSP